MYADSLKRILKRTDERRGCIVGWLTFWNPKNLQKKVDMYGYHFSWKTHAVMIFLALAGVIGIGAVFRLKAGGVVIALTAVIMMLPVLVLDMYHKMYEQKRFADAAEYMEQMLYAFQKTGKILSALKETREIFEEGKMRSCIEQVILKLEFGDFSAGENVFESALEPIESQYQCPKIKMLHELLINAEEHGGEMSESALLLLEDIELWKRRGYQLQAEKKKSHTDNIISVIVSVILCATALYVLDSMKDLFVVKTDFNIFGVGIIQVSSLVFLLFLLWVFVKSSRNLTNDWLATEKVEKEQEISSSCEMVYHYNEKKEKRKSMLWALPAAGMMLAAVLAGKLILAGILFPVTLFLAMHVAIFRKCFRQFADGTCLLFVIAIIAIEHLLESPLSPMVITGLTSTYFTVPIKRETDFIQLFTVAVDIVHSGDGRVLSGLDSILFCRKSVCVISHRVQHVETLQTFITGINITSNVS